MAQKNNLKITSCVLCGKPIHYTTCKPLKCSNCKNIKLNKNAPMKTKWKKETTMIRAMDELFPNSEYIVNGYYSWLKSPKGKPMQLDWYSPDLKIAVEFNGQQHYEYIKYFQRTKKDFKYLQDCDKTKKEICKKRKIILLSIPYDTKVTPETMAKIIKEENSKLYNKLLESGILCLKNREESNS